MPDFTVAPGETITLNVTGVAAAGAPAPANNNANYPNAAANGASVASNNYAFGGGGLRRNRKNKTNRRNRKNKTNRRNRMY